MKHVEIILIPCMFLKLAANKLARYIIIISAKLTSHEIRSIRIPFRLSLLANQVSIVRSYAVMNLKL